MRARARKLHAGAQACANDSLVMSNCCAATHIAHDERGSKSTRPQSDCVVQTDPQLESLLRLRGVTTPLESLLLTLGSGDGVRYGSVTGSRRHHHDQPKFIWLASFWLLRLFSSSATCAFRLRDAICLLVPSNRTLLCCPHLRLDSSHRSRTRLITPLQSGKWRTFSVSSSRPSLIDAFGVPLPHLLPFWMRRRRDGKVESFLLSSRATTKRRRGEATKF